jgi:hypothetical protein
MMVNTRTDFSNAIIDNPDFLKHLRKKGSQNIPNEIRNKQELGGELLKRNLDQSDIDTYLDVSQLPETRNTLIIIAEWFSPSRLRTCAKISWIIIGPSRLYVSYPDVY